VCEPHLALHTTQSAARAVLINVGQLRAQGLHAREATRGLVLKVLEIGERCEEGSCTTRNLEDQMLLQRVGVV
jgi:hypothetical protein